MQGTRIPLHVEAGTGHLDEEGAGPHLPPLSGARHDVELGATALSMGYYEPKWFLRRPGTTHRVAAQTTKPSHLRPPPTRTPPRRTPSSTRAGVLARAPLCRQAPTARPRGRVDESAAPSPARCPDRDRRMHSWPQPTSPKARVQRRILDRLLRELLFGPLQPALHRGNRNLTSIRDFLKVHSRNVPEDKD